MNSGGPGIILQPAGLNLRGSDNQILNNNIFSSGSDGIFIIGDRTIVKGNSVNGANGFGINVGNALSRDNQILENKVNNVKVPQIDLIPQSGNPITGIGIRIGAVAVNTIVDGNTVTGNESIGIEVIGSPLQGSTVVTQNIVVGNAGEVVGVGAGQIVSTTFDGGSDAIIADNIIATQIV